MLRISISIHEVFPQSGWVFDSCAKLPLLGTGVCRALALSTGLVGAGIADRHNNQERKPMSKIIHFLGLDVHQEAGARPLPQNGI